MKTLRRANPECQKEIKYGSPLYVLPYREPVYCSVYCFARHMGVNAKAAEYDRWS